MSSGDAAPPAPKRRRRGAAVAEGGGPGPDTAVLGAPKRAAAAPVTVGAPVDGGLSASGPSAPARSRSGDHPGVSRALRVLAWVLALPIALVAVGIPARKAGYLNSQRLLDVIVKHDIGRFLPLLVIVALWALVTAVLVTVFIEGARRLAHERGGGGSGSVAPVPAGGSRTRRSG